MTSPTSHETTEHNQGFLDSVAHWYQRSLTKMIDESTMDAETTDELENNREFNAITWMAAWESADSWFNRQMERDPIPQEILDYVKKLAPDLNITILETMPQERKVRPWVIMLDTLSSGIQNSMHAVDVLVHISESMHQVLDDELNGKLHDIIAELLDERAAFVAATARIMWEVLVMDEATDDAKASFLSRFPIIQKISVNNG